jgi:hypothetical protein
VWVLGVGVVWGDRNGLRGGFGVELLLVGVFCVVEGVWW